MTSNRPRLALVVPLLASAAMLSGCLGPTYGTGKSQGQTLFDDLNNVVSLGGGGGSDGERIAYTPRPDLVKPDNTSVLPPPRQTAASSLPESPEQRSARIQASAYQGDGPIPADMATARKEGVPQGYLDRTSGGGGGLAMLRRENEATTLTPQELRGRGEMMRERLKDSRQGSPEQRKYLSEPPIAYRKPATTAPVGEVGTSEEVKERRLHQDESLASKIRNALPF